eukprot:CAMPEP_0119307748 /NCGR_PEP_ID=MMETSP1333-20130426/8148_1 /TAXON_ID=418940 /ORGANISM="Scyphosphaera apsteinii, Strain RCC1455" /LENGTH=254 /DNA_ID=CAMNT_0007311351 /DNA_START=32 /DNA_END=796 /DNA_ORIENTATION=+
MWSAASFRSVLLVIVASRTTGGPLPSCEDDTSRYCLSGDDLSQEAIQTCLRALDSEVRSQPCSEYIRLLDGCSAELEFGGVCYEASMNGEAIPCLVQRTAPDLLSEGCQASLPAKEAVVGLKKFWADGKRVLDDEELAELDADDKDTYKRWLKKKKGPKSGKEKERNYAVKTQKKAQAIKRIEAAAEAAAKAALQAGDGDVVVQHSASAAVKEEMDRCIKEDMTNTLSKLSKKEIADIAKASVKKAKASLKGEL